MNPDFSLSIFLNLYLHIFIREVWNLALGAFAPHRNRENLGKIYVFLIVWTIVVSTFSWGNLGKNRETAFYRWFPDFSFFKKEGGEILLEEQIVNWIKCEKCNTKLIPHRGHYSPSVDQPLPSSRRYRPQFWVPKMSHPVVLHHIQWRWSLGIPSDGTEICWESIQEDIRNAKERNECNPDFVHDFPATEWLHSINSTHFLFFY